MNANRGSHLMGAALGSALALTLCVKAHAADIYEAPSQPAYEAPPPPPLDRGIYIKGYIGQANPSVGSTWNEIYNTNAFQIFHEDIKSSPLFGVGIGWQHSLPAACAAGSHQLSAGPDLSMARHLQGPTVVGPRPEFSSSLSWFDYA